MAEKALKKGSFYSKKWHKPASATATVAFAEQILFKSGYKIHKKRSKKAAKMVKKR
jgi:hypothetical protein